MRRAKARTGAPKKRAFEGSFASHPRSLCSLTSGDARRPQHPLVSEPLHPIRPLVAEHQDLKVGVLAKPGEQLQHVRKLMIVDDATHIPQAEIGQPLPETDVDVPLNSTLACPPLPLSHETTGGTFLKTCGRIFRTRVQSPCLAGGLSSDAAWAVACSGLDLPRLFPMRTPVVVGLIFAPLLTVPCCGLHRALTIALSLPVQPVLILPIPFHNGRRTNPTFS